MGCSRSSVYNRQVCYVYRYFTGMFFLIVCVIYYLVDFTNSGYCVKEIYLSLAVSDCLLKTLSSLCLVYTHLEYKLTCPHSKIRNGTKDGPD